MRLFAFALAATSALVAMPRPASACSLATNDLWIENSNHATDTVPPSAPTVGAVEVTRHREDENQGCSQVAGCGSFGTMRIAVSALDDRAGRSDIGYEVTIVGGDGPVAFDPSRDRVRPLGEDLIFFFDVQSPGFSVDLEIRAVDGNGNIGEPTLITVTDEEPDRGGGCDAGHGGNLVGFGLIAFAMALAMRRRH